MQREDDTPPGGAVFDLRVVLAPARVAAGRLGKARRKSSAPERPGLVAGQCVRLPSPSAGDLDGQAAALAELVATTPWRSWARTGQDVWEAHARGLVATLGALDGLDELRGDDLDVLERVSLAGVRCFGLGGAPASAMAPAVREVVRQCERVGLVVDLAAASPQTFIEALEVATLPLLVSAEARWTELDDLQLRALASRGACVAVALDASPAPSLGSPPAGRVPGPAIEEVVERVAERLEHLVDRGGEDLPSVCSAFGGHALDQRSLPRLVETLARRGVRAKTLAKLFGGNALRVLDEVPAFGKVSG